MTVSSNYTTQMQFAHALAIIRTIPKNSTLQPLPADKLQFYGLYKQASEGDVNVPRPSSRQVVEYAKWKAWSRMKGMSPIEAQKLYVVSLTKLLTEIVHRYPHHEQIEFIKKALYSLQFEAEPEDEDEFQDAFDPAEFEQQDHFLNHIEPQHLTAQDIMSPPPSFYSSSTSTSRYLNNNKTNNKQSNLSESTHDYPLTPLTSPGHNSVTSQWVQKQQQQLKKKNGGYVHPMDFLQQGHDLVSEADTIDREVAAVTSTLALSSPRQSPYSKGTPSIHQQLQKPQEEHPVMDKKADRALEKLQTEVSALAEQIDRVRKNMKKREERDRQNKWSAVQLTKTLLKHVLANSAILLIIFYVLYKRKSPIAYAMMGYIMPLVQELMRNIIKRVVFWKVTV